ncbi:putative transcription factor TDA9 [Rhypophila sp. PSN 637]
MASLKFIMDVNNEDDQPGHHTVHTNKRERPSGQSANMGQDHEASPNTQPHPRNVSSTGVAVQEDINPAPPASQSKRRGTSTRGSKSVGPISSSSSSLPTTARRPSTTSNDSMDPTSGGYGSGASSSSLGPARLHASNSPMRPMPPMPPNPPNIPMRLTPITGRVSRAKKGVPVHVCDICTPAKTFTRAEHLRRHQLSHQTPGYPCTYPGCDRAFHRPDLLARHQQRHEQEGDSVSSKTGSSVRGLQHPSLRQSPAGSSPVVSSSGQAAASPSSTADVPQTPGAPATQQSYSQLSSPAPGSHPSTPHTIYGGMSSSVSIINPAPPSSLGGGYQPVMEPYRPARSSSPRAMYMMTNPLPSLQIPDLPGLCHPNDDVSPFPSSASNSSTTYTPVSDIPGQPHRYWMQQPNNTHRSPTSDWPRLVSPYPNVAQRDLNSPGGGSMEGMQAPPPPLFYPNHSSYSSGPQPQTFRGPMLDVSMTGYGPAEGGRGSGLSSASTSTFRPLHQHSNSITSVRNSTPPPNTSSHTTAALVSSALPSRVDALASLGRQKEMLADTHPGLILDGIGVLGGLGVGYERYNEHDGAGRSPGGDHGTTGVDMLSALNLEMGGACGMPGVAMAIPLARPVRLAIPGYLEVYWSQVHPQLPIVHRPSFEQAPHDILRCAMAAVATQYLNGREDRIRGNHLHEYAWQEAKRVTQWDLQIMQAILLCEHFARFRGRKAVTKTSKLFESLYSRVSSPQFLATSLSLSLSSSFSSSSIPSDDGGLWLVDTGAWSPSTASVASSDSSWVSATPTTATNTTMSTAVSSYSVPPQMGTHPSTPWGSFSSSYSPSFNSPLRNVSSSNSSFGHGFASSSPHTPSPPRVRASWSSLFAPKRSNQPTLSFPPQAQAGAGAFGHTYSQGIANQQVLYHNPAMFDHALHSAADQHMSAEERWRTWLDVEQRRRLLTASFVTDGHAAIYQQQRRALDCHMNPPTIPLSGRSSALWEASSAEEWASLLDADPGAGVPTFVPPAEQITPESLQQHTPFDRMAILGVEMLRLPRRQLRSVTSVSANNSPVNEIESHTQHVGSQFDLDQPSQLQLSLQPDPQDPLSLEAEERIASLYRHCPVANTYLALHHTPLHDLLAVGGDSWVFSQKVLPATSFHEHQKRLKLWAEQYHRPAANSSNISASNSGIAGLNAARATVYAARAIILYLERGYNPRQPSGNVGMAPSWSNDMSDYWGLYVCALICWAFGHRARTSSMMPMGGDTRQHQRHRSSSGGNSPISAGGGGSNGISSNTATIAAEEEVFAWLRMVAAPEVRLEDVIRVRGRREAGGVVGLVRRQLENDCVGGRSRLYVDAVGVLRKLEEGVNWKWF